MDSTCNHQEHTALTQDWKDSSAEDIDSVTTPTTSWLTLDSKQLRPSLLQCRQLTLPEKHVALVKVVNSRILLCTNHSYHCIITPHDTLTSLISHPYEENHQIAQLVPCQNKQDRMVQFSTNTYHKVWASPSISSYTKRAQEQCHMLHLGIGHPKSFSTPASLAERVHDLPILSLLCHLRDQPLNDRCTEILNFILTAFHCIFINKQVTILTVDCQILPWKISPLPVLCISQPKDTDWWRTQM